MYISQLLTNANVIQMHIQIFGFRNHIKCSIIQFSMHSNVIHKHLYLNVYNKHSNAKCFIECLPNAGILQQSFTHPAQFIY